MNDNPHNKRAKLITYIFIIILIISAILFIYFYNSYMESQLDHDNRVTRKVQYELTFDNNQDTILQFIGGKAPVKEYNWRPLLAMLTVLIVLIVIYVIYRWRRRV